MKKDNSKIFKSNMDMIKSYGYGIVMHTVRCREHMHNIEQHKLKTMDTYHGTVWPGKLGLERSHMAGVDQRRLAISWAMVYRTVYLISRFYHIYIALYIVYMYHIHVYAYLTYHISYMYIINYQCVCGHSVLHSIEKVLLTVSYSLIESFPSLVRINSFGANFIHGASSYYSALSVKIFASKKQIIELCL